MCGVLSSKLRSRSYPHYWSGISYTTGPNPVNGRFVSATATLLVRLGMPSLFIWAEEGLAPAAGLEMMTRGGWYGRFQYTGKIGDDENK